MKHSRCLVILLALVAILGWPAAHRVAARGPALRVDAPAQVAAGAQMTLTLTIEDAQDFGGYEAVLRFDPTAAHFNGIEHRLEALRQIGRGIGPLGAVEQPGGITFGTYSCPTSPCTGDSQGTRQDRGGSGAIVLATVDLVADLPGTLELALDGLTVVDTIGRPVQVQGANQTVRIQVGGPGAGPLYHAPAPVGVPTPRAAVGAAGPFDLGGDRRVTHADVIEAALGWTLSREAGTACGDLARLAADTNHDGCLTVVDLQLITAHYSLAGPRPGTAPLAVGATFTVNVEADDADAQPGDGVCATGAGVCTLRAALAEANLAPGMNTIAFAIPGGGVRTITLTQPLPTLSDESGPTTIDGYSQPGAQPNGDPQVSNAAVRVQLAVAAGIGAATIEALHITSRGNSVRGIAIFGFRRAIFVFGDAADGNIITGNFIGTDAAANYIAPATASSGNGVELSQGAASNRIGGSAPAERNVISGNPKNGIATFNGGTDKNVVIGNLIGLAPDGKRRLANLSHGIDINSHSSNNIIGGNAPGERNVISGNDAEGVEISHGQRTVGNQVLGNFIGTDVSGAQATAATRNGWHGVHIEDGPVGSIVTGNVIGNNGLGGVSIDGFETGFYPVGNHIANNRIGVALDDAAIPNAHFGVQVKDHASQSTIGPGNIIANNPVGVQIVGNDTDFNTITRNSIYGNAGLGIDLDPLGAPNPNDPGDTDAGPNEQRNFPVLTRATQFQASGTACAGCTVEVFLADGGEGASGEGKTFAGAATAAGDGTFVANLSGVAVGAYVTATATDAQGNTSEFALNRRAVDGPRPGPGQSGLSRFLPLVSR